MKNLTRSARTRWGASLTAAVALSGAAVLVPSAASSATPPTATVDYLADAYNLPAGHVLENLTFERFEFLLGSEGTFAFLVGSPTDIDLRRVAPRVDAVARDLGVGAVYTFDPVLDGADVDIRTSPLADVAALYTRVTETLNQDVTPEFGEGSDPFLFVYDRDRESDGAADRVAGSLTAIPSAAELATDGGAAAFDAEVRHVLTSGGELDESTQREFYTAEVNRKHAVQYLGRPSYGPDILTAADQDFRLVNVTYPELKHVLGSPGDHVIFFGGTWCHNTRAVIKDVNDQAVATGIDTVYVFDNRLDGKSVGNLHIRDTSSALSFLYGDLVRTYLPNLVTQYTPESNGVTYHPGGDTDASPLVAKKLQVPYVLQYDKQRTVDGSAAPIKRQWIQDKGDGTYREYMTEWWYRNHLPGGLTNETTIASQYAFADEAVGKLVELFAAIKADRTPAAPNPTPDPRPTPTPTPTPTLNPTPSPPVPAPARTTVKISLSTARPTYGTQVRATVTVTGGVVGKVAVREGKKVLATVSVPASGRAVAKLPVRLGVGKHTVVAQFTPTSTAKAESSTSAKATITVRKARATTVVKVAKKPAAGKRGTLRVTVTAKGSSVRASGSYVVKVRGKVVAKGNPADDATTVRLPKLARGKHRVTVSYNGSPQVAKANRTITVTVR